MGGTKNINIEIISLLKPYLVIAGKEENVKDQIIRLKAPLYVSVGIHIMKLYENIFINGLPFSILLIVLARLVFKTQKFKSSIRWSNYVIIIQGFLALIFLIQSLIDSESSTLSERIPDSYGFVYALMILINISLPLLILLKPSIGKNIWLLFAISVILNFGWIMESWLTIITSIHSDYETIYPIKQLVTVFKGMIIGFSMLTIDYLTQINDFDIIKKNTSIGMIVKSIASIIVISAMFIVGEWFSLIYGFDPPYGLFYSGLILKVLSLSLGVFLIVFYVEKGIKRLNPNK